MEDIRWKQRFDNYEKALRHLEQALSVENPDIIQKAGMVQFFEMTFELSWKMLKDYLEEQGFEEVVSPRKAIKKAFETSLVQDGHGWMQMLENRNLAVHTYDEETADQVVAAIRGTYYPLLKELYATLKAEF